MTPHEMIERFKTMTQEERQEFSRMFFGLGIDLIDFPLDHFPSARSTAWALMSRHLSKDNYQGPYNQ
jgi:hypothetical protein